MKKQPIPNIKQENGNGNGKIIVNETFINQLESTWSSIQSEYLSNLMNNNNSSTSSTSLSDEQQKELNLYLEQLKNSVLESFKEQVQVYTPPPPPKSQLSKIRELEEEADPNLVETCHQLSKELESIVNRVVLLRQDVPSIVQAEVSQNLQKLSPSLSNSNNNNNQNNTGNILLDMSNTTTSNLSAIAAALSASTSDPINLAIDNINSNLESVAEETYLVDKNITNVLENSKKMIQVNILVNNN
eukprot:gene2186-2689_t